MKDTLVQSDSQVEFPPELCPTSKPLAWDLETQHQLLGCLVGDKGHIWQVAQNLYRAHSLALAPLLELARKTPMAAAHPAPAAGHSGGDRSGDLYPLLQQVATGIQEIQRQLAEIKARLPVYPESWGRFQGSWPSGCFRHPGAKS
jgi:hypothetical protein